MKEIIMKAYMALIAVLIIQLPVNAAEYTLRFAHFFPAVSSQHKEIFQVWADQVEKDSKGRIAVDMYPSSTLSKPPAQYDAVINRIADITATIQGYTANRFPLTQIVELSGLSSNALHGSCIVQGLYDEGLIASEYKKTRPLFLFTFGQGHIHTIDKAIKEPSDLAGLRIRPPSAVVAKLLKNLDAKPIGMPAPQTYQALQRGVLDGAGLSWDGQLTFRLNELTTKHTEVGGLYTLAFVVTMNKEVYNQMPADLKKVIDDNSGLAWSLKAAKVYNALDVKGRAQAIEKGNEIMVIEGGVNNPAWKPILDKVTEDYLSELEAKGLPARKVYARAKELSASCI